MTAALISGAPSVLGAPAIDVTNATTPSSSNTTVYSFADSCNEYKVHQINEDVWLMASCRNDTGGWPYTQINLDHCITNNMGVMEARADGYFGRSCDRTLIHGARPVLYAFCDNGREFLETVLDIGYFVNNDNGHLNCFGYYGTAW
ncbi:hypothetical protein F5Y08DRAFT_349544 [Xylaria arbuscula]|nr:hypothetical protein F5Y08DRAFT_349544 [Xylaria arbuscula]